MNVRTNYICHRKVIKPSFERWASSNERNLINLYNIFVQTYEKTAAETLNMEHNKDLFLEFCHFVYRKSSGVIL